MIYLLTQSKISEGPGRLPKTCSKHLDLVTLRTWIMLGVTGFFEMFRNGFSLSVIDLDQILFFVWKLPAFFYPTKHYLIAPYSRMVSTVRTLLDVLNEMVVGLCSNRHIVMIMIDDCEHLNDLKVHSNPNTKTMRVFFIAPYIHSSNKNHFLT